jgi:starch phosphorylase
MTDDWIDWVMQWNDSAKSVASADVLNEKPAGGHGFCRVNHTTGDFEFSDGTPVRFWGTQVWTMAATPPHHVSENISKVLYPQDDMLQGQELRLKQEYMLVSASLQDILSRFRSEHEDWSLLPEKAAIQLNDTHPALAIPELMRLLMDREGLGWEEAWGITVKVFAYTNHTVLPEALEKWKISLIQNLLPRHMEIIYEINRRFLEEVERRYPGDMGRLARMSIIEDGPEPLVRMANLAIVGSHSVNGVSALHTEILKKSVPKDFYEFFPEKFNNKTNGITPRRWLKKANSPLSFLITNAIGEGWTKDLDTLCRMLLLFLTHRQDPLRWAVPSCVWLDIGGDAGGKCVFILPATKTMPQN